MRLRTDSGCVLPAKLVRPKPYRVTHRARLYARLDDALKQKLVWLSAPAGSGKTVLVSSYLEERDLPHLWYQVDASDNDPASFFHYLGLAVQDRRQKSCIPACLPALVPEGMPNFSLFARRFLECFVCLVGTPWVLVLDNYHEVSDSSALHAILAEAVNGLLPSVNIIVISRTTPPPSFSRLQVYGQLSSIGFDELRLTFDEAESLAHLRGAEAADLRPHIEQCLAESQGWIAGMVLLLGQSGAYPTEYKQSRDLTRSLLFSFFVREVFGELPETIQSMLISTSVLPKFSAAEAEALTGMPESGSILNDLYLNGLFVQRRDEPDAIFEYHPLFGEFLQAEARRSLGPDIFNSLLRRAASVLASASRIQEAIPYWLECGDYEQVADVVPALAQMLLIQGRHQTLDAWLEKLPDEVFHRDGWLAYWRGVARNPKDPQAARHFFECAFASFDRSQQADGLYLSWAAIVGAFVAIWGEFKTVDPWMDALERVRRLYPEFPSLRVELRVTGALIVQLYRKPDDPGLDSWASHGMQLLAKVDDPAEAVELVNFLQNYCVWKGKLKEGQWVSEHFRPSPDNANPLAYIFWHAIRAMHAWNGGEPRIALNAVTDGLKLAADFGIHVWDFMLYAQGVYSALVAGDLTGC